MNEKPYIQIEYLIQAKDSHEATKRAYERMEKEGWKNGIVEKVVQKEPYKYTSTKFKVICRAFHLAQD